MTSLRAAFLLVFSAPFSFRHTKLLPAVVLCGILTGCATGDYAYVTRISTGERINIPLEKGMPEMAKKGNVIIRMATLVPNRSPEKKEIQYLFGLEDKSPLPPKSVRVEDVTEERAILMVDDLDPKLTNQRWMGTSRLYSGDDPDMVWLTHLDNSMRVFRFTIVESDGTKMELIQGWMVPSWAKAAMRQAVGLK